MLSPLKMPSSVTIGTTRLRAPRRSGAPRTVVISRRPTLTISATDSNGMAKTSPSISTIRLGRIASVRGSLMMTVVPRPGSLSSSTVPLSSSIFERTMSMPMPRPETSLTFSAVLRPGIQTSW